MVDSALGTSIFRLIIMNVFHTSAWRLGCLYEWLPLIWPKNRTSIVDFSIESWLFQRWVKNSRSSSWLSGYYWFVKILSRNKFYCCKTNEWNSWNKYPKQILINAVTWIDIFQNPLLLRKLQIRLIRLNLHSRFAKYNIPFLK